MALTAGKRARPKATLSNKNSGIVWDDDSMAKYLRDPRGSMPGNKMAFPGIKNDEEMANLLAYLHQATQ